MDKSLMFKDWDRIISEAQRKWLELSSRDLEQINGNLSAIV